MADVIIYVNGIDAGEQASDINYHGVAFCENDPFSWAIDIPTNALAATVNATIKSVVIAGAEGHGHTVGALDKKTIVGAAVGL
jgi:hypothetical protein